MSEDNSLQLFNQTTLSVGNLNVDLEKINAQIQAMQSANMGGGARTSGIDVKGRTKVEVQKTGTLTFNNPFTGRPDGGKMITVIPVNVKFHLERWLNDNEEIPGVDSAAQKGPLCQTVQYIDPTNANVVDETGWFYMPAMSAYHAQKMLKDLTGSGGCDGQQGLTLCSECPLSKQGLKGKDAACKPSGIMDMVIFKVGDEFLDEPIYAYMKLPLTSIIAYSEYVEKLTKVHKDINGNPIITPIMQIITTIEAEKVVSGARTYGRPVFHAGGRVNSKIYQDTVNAIQKTQALIAQASSTTETSKSNTPF